MRKVIVNLAVSLDGLIEGPNGEYDWCIMEPELNFDEFLNTVDTVLFGRKSYDAFLKELKNQGDSEIGKAMQTIDEKEKIVFSRRTIAIEGADAVVNEDVVAEVKLIKEKEGKGIWFYGGADLLTQFIKAGLIDEYQLAVHPIVLGQGKPLFSGLEDRVNLKLVDTKRYSSGLVMLTYNSL